MPPNSTRWKPSRRTCVGNIPKLSRRRFTTRFRIGHLFPPPQGPDPPDGPHDTDVKAEPVPPAPTGTVPSASGEAAALPHTRGPGSPSSPSSDSPAPAGCPPSEEHHEDSPRPRGRSCRQAATSDDSSDAPSSHPAASGADWASDVEVGRVIQTAPPQRPPPAADAKQEAHDSKPTISPDTGDLDKPPPSAAHSDSPPLAGSLPTADTPPGLDPTTVPGAGAQPREEPSPAPPLRDSEAAA